MNSWILAFSLALLATGFTPSDADAKRLGGGGYSGMQRQTPPRGTPTEAPARPAQANPAPAATPGAMPAPAPRRSWMGPIAGLAAGLGIAALMSHLGMGAEFGNLIMMVLLGVVAFVAIRFVMARLAGSSARRPQPGHAGLQFAGEASGAGAPSGSGWGASPPLMPTSPPSLTANEPAAAHSAADRPGAVPAGFDQTAFERIAKLIFIRLQAANDAGDLADLRQFTTPEMYASIKLDLQDRLSSEQHTEVIHVDAEVIAVVEEAERQVVSVRYSGTIREEADGAAAAFDEVWHLVQPTVGGAWAIAGIQQTQ